MTPEERAREICVEIISSMQDDFPDAMFGDKPYQPMVDKMLSRATEAFHKAENDAIERCAVHMEKYFNPLFDSESDQFNKHLEVKAFKSYLAAIRALKHKEVG